VLANWSRSKLGPRCWEKEAIMPEEVIKVEYHVLESKVSLINKVCKEIGVKWVNTGLLEDEPGCVEHMGYIEGPKSKVLKFFVGSVGKKHAAKEIEDYRIRE
jgi:hypothetical protein